MQICGGFCLSVLDTSHSQIRDHYLNATFWGSMTVNKLIGKEITSTDSAMMNA